MVETLFGRANRDATVELTSAILKPDGLPQFLGSTKIENRTIKRLRE